MSLMRGTMGTVGYVWVVKALDGDVYGVYASAEACDEAMRQSPDKTLQCRIFNLIDIRSE